MQETENYKLKKPDKKEFYDIGIFNDNADVIDRELANIRKTVGNDLNETLKSISKKIENLGTKMDFGGNAKAEDVLEGKTFTNDNGRQVGTLVDRGEGQTITPSVKGTTLEKGAYKGDIVIKGDENLKAENIKKGVNIFNIDGTCGEFPEGWDDEKIVKTNEDIKKNDAIVLENSGDWFDVSSSIEGKDFDFNQIMCGISISSDGKYIALGSISHPYIVLYKYNEKQDKYLKMPNPDILPTNYVNNLKFVSNNNKLFVANNGYRNVQFIYSVDAEKGLVNGVRPYAGDSTYTHHCDCSQDGEVYVSCGERETSDNGRYLYYYTRHPDGKWIFKEDKLDTQGLENKEIIPTVSPTGKFTILKYDNNKNKLLYDFRIDAASSSKTKIITLSENSLKYGNTGNNLSHQNNLRQIQWISDDTIVILRDKGYIQFYNFTKNKESNVIKISKYENYEERYLCVDIDNNTISILYKEKGGNVDTMALSYIKYKVEEDGSVTTKIKDLELDEIKKMGYSHFSINGDVFLYYNNNLKHGKYVKVPHEELIKHLDKNKISNSQIGVALEDSKGGKVKVNLFPKLQF